MILSRETSVMPREFSKLMFHFSTKLLQQRIGNSQKPRESFSYENTQNTKTRLQALLPPPTWHRLWMLVLSVALRLLLLPQFLQRHSAPSSSYSHCSPNCTISTARPIVAPCPPSSCRRPTLVLCERLVDLDFRTVSGGNQYLSRAPRTRTPKSVATTSHNGQPTKELLS